MRKPKGLAALLAVGLLAGPMAASAALVTYTGNAGENGSYLTIEAVVSSTGQGVRDPNSGLDSWVMTAFAAGGAVLAIVDSQNPFFLADPFRGQFIRFDASGSVDAWELIGGHTDGSSGICYYCWSGYQSGFGEWDFTGVDDIMNRRGSWTSSPVPLPAAAWLLLSGLAGLGFMARRRKAA